MLDKKAKKLLKCMYKKGYLSTDEVDQLVEHFNKNTLNEYVSYLKRENLISYCLGKTNEYGEAPIIGYAITMQGRAFVENERYSLFIFWVPYIITTLIAISSLIVALCNKSV